MEDDNIFDEDDALDYIMFEKHEHEKPRGGNSGCFSILLILVIPSIAIFISKI